MRALCSHCGTCFSLCVVYLRRYFELTLLTLRAVVQDGDDFQRRVRCPHTEYVRHGHVIMDSCQEVAADHIKVGSSAEESSVSAAFGHQDAIEARDHACEPCREVAEIARAYVVWLMM